jgi:hypothetical protein
MGEANIEIVVAADVDSKNGTDFSTTAEVKSMICVLIGKPMWDGLS